MIDNLNTIATGEARAEGFSPIESPKSKVLLLGSMPSLESLKQHMYYGHPRNHFWPIMYRLFSEPLPPSYGERQDFLRKKGIAVWDVYAACKRKGSLDQAIREEEYNDLHGFWSRHPRLQVIFFNGRKAQQGFLRYQRNLKRGACFLGDTHLLPSSSPIPTKTCRNMEDKIDRWSKILDYLGE